jgi:hypothetical protein
MGGKTIRNSKARNLDKLKGENEALCFLLMLSGFVTAGLCRGVPASLPFIGV